MEKVREKAFILQLEKGKSKGKRKGKKKKEKEKEKEKEREEKREREEGLKLLPFECLPS